MVFQQLSEDHKHVLETSRNLASQLMQAGSDFTADDLQTAYNDVVKNHPDHPGFQIALGTAFGDLVAREKNYKWVRIIDEYGEETALSPSDVNLACFPISMMQKRLSDRLQINIQHLVAETIQTVEEMRRTGNHQKP